jgi:Flp pilus assembly protein TadD
MNFLTACSRSLLLSAFSVALSSCSSVVNTKSDATDTIVTAAPGVHHNGGSASKLPPDDVDHADAAYARGDWEAAEAWYRKLTQHAGRHPYPWFRLGNIYARTHRLELAVNAYGESLKRDANQPKALHNLALANLMIAKEALETGVNRLTTEEPSAQMSRELLAELRQLMGGSQSAERAPNESTPPENTAPAEEKPAPVEKLKPKLRANRPELPPEQKGKAEDVSSQPAPLGEYAALNELRPDEARSARERSRNEVKAEEPRKKWQRASTSAAAEPPAASVWEAEFKNAVVRRPSAASKQEVQREALATPQQKAKEQPRTGKTAATPGAEPGAGKSSPVSASESASGMRAAFVAPPQGGGEVGSRPLQLTLGANESSQGNRATRTDADNPMRYYEVTYDGIFLRAQPSANANIVLKLAQHERLAGFPVMQHGAWIQVIHSSGATGWVIAKHIEPRDVERTASEIR